MSWESDLRQAIARHTFCFNCRIVDPKERNGQKRYMTEINASTFQVLTPRATQPQPQGSVFGQAVAQDYQQGMDAQADAYADDLPF